MFASELAVIGNGKAVRFLLDPSDQGKDSGACLDADLLALRGDERARAVTVVLDHAEDRQVDAHCLQRLAHRFRMDRTAVDQQDVRPLVKALVSVEIVAEAAA